MPVADSLIKSCTGDWYALESEKAALWCVLRANGLLLSLLWCYRPPIQSLVSQEAHSLCTLAVDVQDKVLHTHDKGLIWNLVQTRKGIGH